MDGLARTAGELFREITVGGKQYRLAPPRLKDLAALEAELLARLPDPVEQAAKAARHLPAEAHPALWQQAFKAAETARKFDLDDMDRLPLMLRVAASAFITLRRHHGDQIQSLDDAVDWLDQASEERSFEELAALCEAAATETPPKKSPPPAAG